MPRLLTTTEFIEKSNIIHNNKYNYSNSIYTGSHNKIEINCPIHGNFYQKAANHLTGRGCSKCGNKLTKEEFITKSNNIHNNRYNYSLVEYHGIYEKVNIICSIHSVFQQTPSNHMLGSGCPKCNPGTRKIGLKETKWLDSLNIDNKHRQVKIQFDKKYIIVDALINNTIYEFLGDYWHGNPVKFDQHLFNVVSKKTFGELHEETLSRISKLKELGYNVVFIWENDWDQKQNNKEIN